MGKTAIPEAQRANAFIIEPEKLKIISDKDHPLYDPRSELPVNPQLVLSMKTAGWRGAMLVWKDGDNIIVLDGHQRRSAAIQANKELRAEGKEPILVKVMVERAEDRDLFATQALMNESRALVSDMERARILSRLIAFGRSEEHAGALLGLDKTQTRRTLALLDCAKQVQDAVESGKVAATAAAKLSKLPREEQTKTLDAILAAGPTERSERASVANVNKAVKKAKGGEVVELPRRKLMSRVLEFARSERGSDTDCKIIVQVLDWVLAGKEPPKNSSLYALITSDEHAEKLIEEKK